MPRLALLMLTAFAVATSAINKTATDNFGIFELHFLLRFIRLTICINFQNLLVSTRFVRNVGRQRGLRRKSSQIIKLFTFFI